MNSAAAISEQAGPQLHIITGTKIKSTWHGAERPSELDGGSRLRAQVGGGDSWAGHEKFTSNLLPLLLPSLFRLSHSLSGLPPVGARRAEKGDGGRAGEPSYRAEHWREVVIPLKFSLIE